MESRPIGALEKLLAEHRVIEPVLDRMERMASAAEERGELDADTARDALRFFREYADRCHHGKEEARLFPLMQERGFRIETCNPAEVLAEEHVRGRELVRAIDDAVDAADTAGFAAAAREYIRHLRAHIMKEDDILFPMALRVLREEDLQRLDAEFEAFDRDEMGLDTIVGLEELSRRLGAG
jgi:hemerythrin-like domain-containing protein